MWGTIIVIALLVTSGVYWFFVIRRMNRKTEAMRQAACIITDLPLNSSMKEFKRMHKEMNKDK